jgi:hypothetical protein
MTVSLNWFSKKKMPSLMAEAGPRPAWERMSNNPGCEETTRGAGKSERQQ